MEVMQQRRASRQLMKIITTIRIFRKIQNPEINSSRQMKKQQQLRQWTPIQIQRDQVNRVKRVRRAREIHRLRQQQQHPMKVRDNLMSFNFFLI
jgi:hypothetical protein